MIDDLRPINGFLQALFLSALLVGCQSTPSQEVVEVAAEEPASAVVDVPPELNIPEAIVDQVCDCGDEPVQAVETDFDHGIRALAARDYSQAASYFERHAQNDNPQSKREAEVGLAFINIHLSDPSADDGSEALDDRAEIMALALSLITEQEDRLTELTRSNVKLADDLRKREAVLKRLRELTLGQLED